MAQVIGGQGVANQEWAATAHHDSKILGVFRHELRADPQQIERMKRIVERVWDGIQAGLFYPSLSAMQCPTCSFRAACRAWTG